MDGSNRANKNVIVERCDPQFPVDAVVNHRWVNAVGFELHSISLVYSIQKCRPFGPFLQRFQTLPTPNIKEAQSYFSQLLELACMAALVPLQQSRLRRSLPLQLLFSVCAILRRRRVAATAGAVTS